MRVSIGTAVAALLLLGLGGSAAAKNSVSVSDAAGDAPGGAPDIASVTVSNDDVLLLTWKIALGDRPELFEGDVITVWLDTDGEVRTGQTGTGYDYSISGAGPTRNRILRFAEFRRWFDNQTVFTGAVVFSEWDPVNRVVSLSVHHRFIEGAPTFRVAVTSGRVGSAARDLAPEAGGSIPYEVIGDRAKPAVKAFAAKAKRGKQATLRYRVVDENPTSEQITLFRGTKRIARFSTRLRPFVQRNLSFRFYVPTRFGRGTFRFCVVAQDEWRNFSEPGCASLRVT
jgi:hypothetical protein